MSINQVTGIKDISKQFLQYEAIICEWRVMIFWQVVISSCRTNIPHLYRVVLLVLNDQSRHRFTSCGNEWKIAVVRSSYMKEQPVLWLNLLLSQLFHTLWLESVQATASNPALSCTSHALRLQ